MGSGVDTSGNNQNTMRYLQISKESIEDPDRPVPLKVQAGLSLYDS